MLIEEVDYIAKNKNLFYSLLAELDSFEEDQCVILATSNKLGEVDKALRRGGRFDIDIRFDMPSSQDRYLILKQHLQAL